MPADLETITRARAYDRAAIEAIFAEHYPIVYRMANGLSGRADVGSGITTFVFKQAMSNLPSWKDEGEPERWFAHHTVLTVRRTRKHQPDLMNDVLITAARTRDAAYPAFIRAIRALPMQQREAFILNHGERMNARYVGVAMDCSTQAATAHLSVADTSLKTLAADRFEPFVEEMARCYRALTPSDALAIPLIRAKVHKLVWSRRMGRLFGWSVVIGFIAAVAWFIAIVRPILDY